VSKDWDHYLCKLGDDLASIYLDLGIATAAPVAGLYHSVRVTVPLVRRAANVPTCAWVTETEQRLGAIAAEFGGKPDGWGCLNP
jgi:hypothetical protein